MRPPKVLSNPPDAFLVFDAPEANGVESGPLHSLLRSHFDLGLLSSTHSVQRSTQRRHWHAYSLDIAIPAIILCSHDEESGTTKPYLTRLKMSQTSTIKAHLQQ